MCAFASGGVCICVYVSVSLHKCLCVSLCLCVCFCIYMHVHVCVWVFVDVCLCLSLCTRAQAVVVNCPCWCTGPYVALPACGPLSVHSPESSLSQSLPCVSGRQISRTGNSAPGHQWLPLILQCTLDMCLPEMLPMSLRT